VASRLGGEGGFDLAMKIRGNAKNVTIRLQTIRYSMKLDFCSSNGIEGSSLITKPGITFAIKLPIGMELLNTVTAVTR
jgi:hypothetical protein